MTNVMEFLKSYFGFLAALGMSGAQVWNLRPSEQSLLAFAGFSLLGIAIIVNAAGVLRARRQARRGVKVVAEPTYGRSARRTAVTALVLTPPIYLVLILLYHIPNTWPSIVQAGAEPRDSFSSWVQKSHESHARSLLNLRDEVAAPLFAPGPEFASSSLIYYVMVGNRSTVASPPFTLRLDLQLIPGSSLPPAQPYYVAVASPAAHPWRPFGDVLSRIPTLSRWLKLPAGGLLGGHTSPTWLKYQGLCRVPPDVYEWCFTAFPTLPETKSTWRSPEIRLPSLPPRGSLEVYLELAFRERQPVSVPVTITVRKAAEGAFEMYEHLDADLGAWRAAR